MKARARRWRSLLFRILLLIAIADWLGLKTGALSHPPWVLAVLAAGVMLALLGHAGGVAVELWFGQRRPGGASGQLLLLIGILVALGGGMANWILGLQGFVLLHEGEAVPLHGGSHLRELEIGPLSRIREVDLVLMLEELELIPAGDGSFYPLSRIRLTGSGGEAVTFEVSPTANAASGHLRFFQGAFGFAPRIVITKRDETIFDRVVPFTTEHRGPSGLSFEGLFTLGKENMEIAGAVELGSLDEGMRGHATLALSVFRDGELLGRGSLIPGHFADVSDGYRIGFAGLEKWSEFDISRRDYGSVILLGATLTLLGGVFWPFARWRNW